MSDVTENIKLLLGDKVEIPDEVLNLYIKMVTQRILNYTNQLTMPEALIDDVLVPMVVEMAQESHSISSPVVGSITEAGRSVVFRQEDFVSVTLGKMNERIKYYSIQLGKYTRMV